MAQQTLECEGTSQIVGWESSFVPGSNFSSLVWRRTEMNSCEAAGFTLITSAVGPALGTILAGTLGREDQGLDGCEVPRAVLIKSVQP